MLGNKSQCAGGSSPPRDPWNCIKFRRCKVFIRGLFLCYLQTYSHFGATIELAIVVSAYGLPARICNECILFCEETCVCTSIENNDESRIASDMLLHRSAFVLKLHANDAGLGCSKSSTESIHLYDFFSVSMAKESPNHYIILLGAGGRW